MLLEEGEEEEQNISYGVRQQEENNMETNNPSGSGVEVTVSSTSGTDVQFENSSGERLQSQGSGLLNVSDSVIETGASLSPGAPNNPGTSGVSSAPATPEAHRQDRGFLIQSSPLTAFGALPEITSIKEGTMLPWGAHKERSSYPTCVNVDINIRPGEFVMRTLFAEFTIQAEKKIESVLADPPERLLSKALQRGEDLVFDQLLSAFGSVAEHCLPSILRALFAWYERQMGVSDPVSIEQKKSDQKGKSSESTERSEADLQQERRDLAVEFIFCLMLIEVLRQLPFHPGHEDLVKYIEDIAFKHFKHREGSQSSPNAANIHIVADLYAEVIGALAQSRFSSVRKRFMAELKELRSKEPSTNPQHSMSTTHSIIALLMGMKFFRVKMVPIEEFEASFQFMQECAQYFLEVKDKDVKHALAGLFVEILVPVAATVKNEVNVPCLKNFVEMLYPQTLDMCTKNKHRLPLFPMVTCLLCVSQKQFFLQNWHYFLAMCLSHLKNKDPKMCRVALEALYRLLWVYMIRIKCESNTATQSRLQSIVNSLFPKGSKAVVPRDTPLNIFVKIIQFIAQERLDFAMREIVFDLLSVGRPIKIILTPERMSIGLRAFLVVADSLQQKEGEPPMPRTVGVMPSGNTLRVKKTFLNKMLTEDTARSIGMHAYFPHVRRVFVDILRALDVHYGRPLMLTNVQNVNKESHATSNPSFSSYFLRQEPDELITGERKPRIDLFRTCVAAVPRLIPDGITGAELVDLLARLTVHMDEELRVLAFQSLQTLVIDFPDWRQDVICGFTQFVARDVQDTFPQLLDNGLRMLLQLLTSWKNALVVPGTTTLRTSVAHSSQPVPTHPPSAASSDRGSERSTISDRSTASEREFHILQPKKLQDAVQKVEAVGNVLHMVEALALVMLCHCRLYPRRLSVHILREVKHLLKLMGSAGPDQPVIDVIDKCCPVVFEKCLSSLPPAEKSAALAISSIDLQWIADRSSSVWTAGFQDENSTKSSSQLNLAGFDPWTTCLFGFLEKDRVLSCCPTAVIHSWPIVFSRINSLFTVIDPTPVSDNRASLLRSSVTVKKPVNERDIYMHVWKTYVAFAFRVVPPIPSPIVRCASPDLSLSSSPDSLTNERGDSKAPSSTQVSPSGLYKLVVPLLRCEAADVRDAAVQALGRVNVDALKDLLEELVLYIREAVDRKQENMRRRRRRDALRLQVVRVLELVAEHGTFGMSSCVLERDTQSLHPTIVEYIEGARIYLESEPEKDLPSTVKLHFCNFLRKMIKSFSLETCHTLLKRDLRRNLFSLFTGWTGRFGRALGVGQAQQEAQPDDSAACTELQLSALQAMSALLCCGPCFDPEALSEDGALYPWLDMLLSSHDEKEYPCDHYTAVINVTLMNTGCPRTLVHETALQLLQVLDKRFFGSVGPLTTDGETGQGKGTLDLLLSTTYCRSQLYLSRQLAQLHPELTMPMFSVSDSHPKEMEEVWSTLCSCWPNNLKVIIRYLLIVSGMAPNELLPFAKRVALHLARARPDRLMDEMTTELQTVETLSWLIERTETPPFFRLTSVRKASSHSAEQPAEAPPAHEKGTIHTKRHSGEDPAKSCCTGTAKSDSALRPRPEKGRTASGPATLPDEGVPPTVEQPEQSEQPEDTYTLSRNVNKYDIPQPHPLPMPEYGGYFAPLTEFLPDCTQPSSGFHRCNLAVMLLTDIVVDGVEVDWSVHVPLMLHMLFLGLDHSRALVHEHCKQLLLNLLVVLAEHCDHLTVARILLAAKTQQLALGVPKPQLPIHRHNFTEPDAEFDSYMQGPIVVSTTTGLAPGGINATTTTSSSTDNTKTVSIVGPIMSVSTVNTVVPVSSVGPVIVIAEDSSAWTSPKPLPGPNMPIQDVIKSLVDFLASRQNQPLWNYEDITAKVWSVHSVEQLDIFLQHVLRVFRDSLPQALISERWAQTALQLGLSCSSRHYAGRSLQLFRALRVPINSRMLSDILSRLVETVAEQGEDMQGYVTELLLTLESAVDSLESDFRPLDFMKEIFKSTPNLNNKETSVVTAGGKRSPGGGATGLFGNGNSPLTCSMGTSGHTRSTSYSVSYNMRKSMQSPANDNKEMRGRVMSELESRSAVCAGLGSKYHSTNLCRSRSAQSLKLLGDSASLDDKMTILAQLFWLAVSLLESDFEHEFLLALRLLSRVLHRLPLDRPDARDKVEKLQAQLRWNNFPGVHALLLKGSTNPNTYDSVMSLLPQFTLLLDLPVVDPTQSLAFPMNVIAMLPYLLLHYEDANELCIMSAENIAQASTDKSKKLENLATVMTLYSRRTFSKESFQWTKCVVKYLYDTYAHLGLNMLAFLVEVLEKGPSSVQLSVLSIIHCMLHYVDLAAAAAQPINGDLLRVIHKYVEGPHWREALKILKLVVTRSSTLVAPPTATHSSHWESSMSSPHPSFTDNELFTKKELPGRTMEFTFDLSQTPLIGRRQVSKVDEKDAAAPSSSVVSTTSTTASSAAGTVPSTGSTASTTSTAVALSALPGPTHASGATPGSSALSPRRSVSLSPADSTNIAGWKRPWMSQGRVRECLVNLLTTCGQRVGLPKSPSVIFSQSSDLMERQSSMASSTEEMSGPNNDLSGGSRRDDGAGTEQFGVFKDFDFLEYESESVEGESTDNFNWGVRRRPLSEGETEGEQSLRQLEESLSEKTPVLSKRNKRNVLEESSDDEVGSESPLDEVAMAPELGGSSSGGSVVLFPPSSLSLQHRRRSDNRSDTSGSSAGDLGDVTPCNASPNLSALMTFRPILRDDTEEAWRRHIQGLLCKVPASPLELFYLLHRLVRDVSSKAVQLTHEACLYLERDSAGSDLRAHLLSLCDQLDARAIAPLVWFAPEVLDSSRLTEALRFGSLEVQEHLDTFLDRKDHLAECVDAVRASAKLELLGESGGLLTSSGELVLDLGRALYKLHFQLVMVLEAANRMVGALTTAAETNQLQDISSEVIQLKTALEDNVEGEQHTPTATPSLSPSATPTPPPEGGIALMGGNAESTLMHLLQESRWTAALSWAKQNRGLWGSEVVPGCLEEDDVISILIMYCKHISHDKSDLYVTTRTEQELRAALSGLLNSLLQVLEAVNSLETEVKLQRQQPQPSNKMDC
ncbi:furry [Frankliniella occidentalis]|nr:furry [Frankliniella occidentalis]